MGRFTQEDPIGLAGGLNLYGFAGGDPVNFSDPFGLCIKDDAECHRLVAQLRAEAAQAKNPKPFTTAADAFDEYTGGRVLFVSPDDKRLTGPHKAGSVGGHVAPDGNVYLNASFGQGDRLISGVHEGFHLAGYPNDDTPEKRAVFRAVEAEAYRNLSPASRKTAPVMFKYLRAWGERVPAPY